MSLKVLGLGLPRTGTSSQKAALEMLGFGQCAHMEGLFANPVKTGQWIELFETGTTDYSELFDGFQSSTDFPGCLLYRELWTQYPDLKFVFSFRDPELWYESLLKTIYAAVPHTEEARAELQLKRQSSPKFDNIGKALGLVNVYLFQRFFAGEFLDKEATIARYFAFRNEVRTRVPAHQLLEFDVQDGWEPLCAFLGVPVPAEPFPFKNKRLDFQEQIGKMLSSGEKLTIV